MLKLKKLMLQTMKVEMFKLFYHHIELQVHIHSLVHLYQEHLLLNQIVLQMRSENTQLKDMVVLRQLEQQAQVQVEQLQCLQTFKMVTLFTLDLNLTDQHMLIIHF